MSLVSSVRFLCLVEASGVSLVKMVMETDSVSV